MKAKFEILKTKLFRPKLPADFVQRPELISILEKHQGIPFCLVSAPAGYGKSTTLSSWLGKCGHKNVWLSLDELDNNFTSFANYFVVGIRNEFPQCCDDLLDIINSNEPPNVNVVANIIQNELDLIHDELIFVLDDFHLIKDEKIHTFLELILLHPPRGFHLVISTRMDPSLRLSKLRASAEMNELRAKKLKFNHEETEQFLSSIDISLNSEQNNILQTEVEGWPAGLRLAALSMKNVESTKNLLEKLPHQNKYIAEYLLKEILIKLSDDEKKILLVSSLFDSFNDSLLSHLVSHKPNSIQKSLSELYLKNYFLIPLDENGEWYRFHHLFQKLLVSETKTFFNENEINLIFRKAAKWFISNGYLEAGIKYYLIVGEAENAITAFSLQREKIMNNSQFFRLHQILQLFTINQINKNAVLKITKAWDQIFEGNTLEMFEDLGKIENLLERVNKSDSCYKNLFGELYVLKSWKLYNLDADFDTTIKTTENALKYLNHDNYYPLGYAWVFYGGAMQCLNRTDEALNILYKQLDHENENLLNYYIFIILNYIFFLEADFKNLFLRANQFKEKAQIAKNKEGLVNAKYFLGIYYFQTNDLGKAQIILKEAYQERDHVIGIHHFGISAALALSSLITGNSELAYNISKELSNFAMHNGNQYFMILRKALDAEINFRLGHFAEAKKWAINCGELPLYPFTNFFVPQITKIKILLYSEQTELQLEADILLKQIEGFLRKSNNQFFLAKLLALKALVNWDLRKKESAFKSLEESLNLAEPSNLIRTFVDLGPKMSSFLIMYATEKSDVGFIGNILKAFSFERHVLNSDDKKQLEINSTKSWQDHLSPREFDVLELLVSKYRNKEIADKLFISPATVKRHTINIYQKLNVNSRSEAAEKAEVLGILNTTLSSN